MKRYSFALACVAALLSAALPAGAQEGVEAVVVSSSRISDGELPSVTFTKRADFLITRVRVTCDTRDLSERRQELKTTLRNMIRTAAQTPTLSLGLGQNIIGELTEKNFDQIIAPDTRADTSRAEVVIQTKVSANDNFDDATARIKTFIEKTPKAGRTEILANNGWDLTIVGPEQYRDEVIKKIVADSKHMSELFGPGYGVNVAGLERRVSWTQRGPLDLALYISYSLEVVPH